MIMLNRARAKALLHLRDAQGDDRLVTTWDIDQTTTDLIRRRLVAVKQTWRPRIAMLTLTDEGHRVAEVWEGRL